MQAEEAKTYLTLSDAGGVEIKTEQDINIHTSGCMLHNCESFDVISKDKIIIATQSSSIVVDSVMHIKG